MLQQVTSYPSKEGRPKWREKEKSPPCCSNFSLEVILKEVEYINVGFFIRFFAFWLIEIGTA